MKKKVLDFSGKRVRLDGKVLSKFDLAYEINNLFPMYHWLITFDAYTYSDLVLAIIVAHFPKCPSSFIKGDIEITLKF